MDDGMGREENEIGFRKDTTLTSFWTELEHYTNTVCSEILCALRLRYVGLVVSIEVAVEVCCCFAVGKFHPFYRPRRFLGRVEVYASMYRYRTGSRQVSVSHMTFINTSTA
jgi:hypothetical protein